MQAPRGTGDNVTGARQMLAEAAQAHHDRTVEFKVKSKQVTNASTSIAGVVKVVEAWQLSRVASETRPPPPPPIVSLKPSKIRTECPSTSRSQSSSDSQDDSDGSEPASNSCHVGRDSHRTRRYVENNSRENY